MKIYWVSNLLSAFLTTGVMTWLGYITAPIPTFVLCVMACVLFDIVVYN